MIMGVCDKAENWKDHNDYFNDKSVAPNSKVLFFY